MNSEYNLKTLQVRRVGSRRKGFGDLVRLEPDVMQAFPDAKAVNEALRTPDRNRETLFCPFSVKNGF